VVVEGGEAAALPQSEARASRTSSPGAGLHRGRRSRRGRWSAPRPI